MSHAGASRVTIDGMTTHEMKIELLTLSDYAWTRLRDRVRGLTDDEYFWEPVAGAEYLTVRPAADGSFRADNDGRPQFPPPDPAPLSTIAWRLAHIATLLSSDRNATWLGLAARLGAEEAPTAATAADALMSLDRAYAVFRSCVDAATEASLAEQMGPIAGPYADATRFGFVLHQLDELIHHGAEVALLRDLYRASGRSSSL
jgi:hypothetical protein